MNSAPAVKDRRMRPIYYSAKSMQLLPDIRIGLVRYLLQFAVCALALALLTSAKAESTDETIHYLFNYIAESHATFIRNGTTHTPVEAMEHVKAKYEHFKNDIKTPEDFIQLAASKSLLSGKPYLVRPAGGGEQRLDEWLTEALKAHRAAGHG